MTGRSVSLSDLKPDEDEILSLRAMKARKSRRRIIRLVAASVAVALIVVFLFAPIMPLPAVQYYYTSIQQTVSPSCAAFGIGEVHLSVRVENATSAYYTFTWNNPDLIVSIETAHPPPTLDNSASATSNVNGLKLSLAINVTTVRSGGAIQVTMSETNTLPLTSNVTSASWVTKGTSISWPFPGGQPFPTDRLDTPMVLAMYSGYFTADNISSGQPLLLLPYQESSMPWRISFYVFQPTSANATTFGSVNQSVTHSDTGAWWTKPVMGSASFWGTYQDINFDSREMQKLPPGFYTIAGGDEWGQLVLLYFVVT
jgi:hypothetical protein